jgi:hypothetical protein
MVLVFVFSYTSDEFCFCFASLNEGRGKNQLLFGRSADASSCSSEVELEAGMGGRAGTAAVWPSVVG